MYERESLMSRSTPLERAANIKLRENAWKPDNWKEMHDNDLLDKLDEETHEIEMLLETYHNDLAGMEEEEFRYELLRECGDIINVLRFIADKYGAI